MLERVTTLIASLEKIRDSIAAETACKHLNITRGYEFILAINTISEQLEKLRSLLPLSDTANATHADDETSKVAAVSDILMAIQKIFIKRWSLIQGTNNEYFEIYNQLTCDLNHAFLNVATLIDHFFKEHSDAKPAVSFEHPLQILIPDLNIKEITQFLGGVEGKDKREEKTFPLEEARLSRDQTENGSAGETSGRLHLSHWKKEQAELKKEPAELKKEKGEPKKEQAESKRFVRKTGGYKGSSTNLRKRLREGDKDIKKKRSALSNLRKGGSVAHGDFKTYLADPVFSVIFCSIICSKKFIDTFRIVRSSRNLREVVSVCALLEDAVKGAGGDARKHQQTFLRAIGPEGMSFCMGRAPKIYGKKRSEFIATYFLKIFEVYLEDPFTFLKEMCQALINENITNNETIARILGSFSADEQKSKALRDIFSFPALLRNLGSEKTGNKVSLAPLFGGVCADGSVVEGLLSRIPSEKRLYYLNRELQIFKKNPWKDRFFKGHYWCEDKGNFECLENIACLFRFLKPSSLAPTAFIVSENFNTLLLTLKDCGLATRDEGKQYSEKLLYQLCVLRTPEERFAFFNSDAVNKALVEQHCKTENSVYIVRYIKALIDLMPEKERAPILLKHFKFSYLFANRSMHEASINALFEFIENILPGNEQRLAYVKEDASIFSDHPERCVALADSLLTFLGMPGESEFEEANLAVGGQAIWKEFFCDALFLPILRAFQCTNIDELYGFLEDTLSLVESNMPKGHVAAVDAVAVEGKGKSETADDRLNTMCDVLSAMLAFRKKSEAKLSEREALEPLPLNLFKALELLEPQYQFLFLKAAFPALSLDLILEEMGKTDNSLVALFGGRCADGSVVEGILSGIPTEERLDYWGRNLDVFKSPEERADDEESTFIGSRRQQPRFFCVDQDGEKTLENLTCIARFLSPSVTKEHIVSDEFDKLYAPLFASKSDTVPSRYALDDLVSETDKYYYEKLFFKLCLLRTPEKRFDFFNSDAVDKKLVAKYFAGGYDNVIDKANETKFRCIKALIDLMPEEKKAFVLVQYFKFSYLFTNTNKFEDKASVHALFELMEVIPEEGNQRLAYVKEGASVFSNHPERCVALAEKLLTFVGMPSEGGSGANVAASEQADWQGFFCDTLFRPIFKALQSVEAFELSDRVKKILSSVEANMTMGHAAPAGGVVEEGVAVEEKIKGEAVNNPLNKVYGALNAMLVLRRQLTERPGAEDEIGSIQESLFKVLTFLGLEDRLSFLWSLPRGRKLDYLEEHSSLEGFTRAMDCDDLEEIDDDLEEIDDDLEETLLSRLLFQDYINSKASLNRLCSLLPREGFRDFVLTHIFTLKAVLHIYFPEETGGGEEAADQQKGVDSNDGGLPEKPLQDKVSFLEDLLEEDARLEYLEVHKEPLKKYLGEHFGGTQTAHGFKVCISLLEFSPVDARMQFFCNVLLPVIMEHCNSISADQFTKAYNDITQLLSDSSKGKPADDAPTDDQEEALQRKVMKDFKDMKEFKKLEELKELHERLCSITPRGEKENDKQEGEPDASKAKYLKHGTVPPTVMGPLMCQSFVTPPKGIPRRAGVRETMKGVEKKINEVGEVAKLFNDALSRLKEKERPKFFRDNVLAMLKDLNRLKHQTWFSHAYLLAKIGTANLDRYFVTDEQVGEFFKCLPAAKEDGKVVSAVFTWRKVGAKFLLKRSFLSDGAGFDDLFSTGRPLSKVSISKRQQYLEKFFLPLIKTQDSKEKRFWDGINNFLGVIDNGIYRLLKRSRFWGGKPGKPTRLLKFFRERSFTRGNLKEAYCSKNIFKTIDVFLKYLDKSPVENRLQFLSANMLDLLDEAIPTLTVPEIIAGLTKVFMRLGQDDSCKFFDMVFTGILDQLSKKQKLQFVKDLLPLDACIREKDRFDFLSKIGEAGYQQCVDEFTKEKADNAAELHRAGALKKWKVLHRRRKEKGTVIRSSKLKMGMKKALRKVTCKSGKVSDLLGQGILGCSKKGRKECEEGSVRPDAGAFKR